MAQDENEFLSVINRMTFNYRNNFLFGKSYRIQSIE